MANRIFTRAFAAGLLALLTLTLGCNSDAEPSKLSVTSVTPRVAPVGSATEVRISGTGFRQGATVSVGVAATNVVVANSSTITAIVQGQASGTLDVVVTNPNGDTTRLAGGFTFQLQTPPTVTSVSPVAGLPSDLILVRGTGFQTGASVTIDGVHSALIRVDSNTARFDAPEHPPGTVDVVVTNPDGQTATFPQGFTYQVVTLSVSANSLTAGSPLSISWVAPSGRPSNDWIALYRPGSPHEAYGDIWWSYTNGAATGSFTVPAPAQPGQYEFRYFGNDVYLLAAKTSLVDVTGSAQRSRSLFRSPLQ